MSAQYDASDQIATNCILDQNDVTKLNNRIKHVLEALSQIKARKQRPNYQRLLVTLNRNHGYSRQEMLELIDYCVENGVLLKIYLKGEYTYMDPDSDSRHAILVNRNYNHSSRVILAMTENPRGATKSYLIDYIIKRFHLRPSKMTHEDLIKCINKCIQQLIDENILDVLDKNKMLLGINSEYYAKNLSKNKNIVNEVSLCKIIIKSEAIRCEPNSDHCSICTESMGIIDSYNNPDFIHCTCCGKTMHGHHQLQSQYVLDNFQNLYWECENCRRCCICREKTKDFWSDVRVFNCINCERMYHLECLKFYNLENTHENNQNDSEQHNKICVICRNEKIFGNYTNLRNGLCNLNLKMDYKAHNTELRQIIKSESANKMRRNLFERQIKVKKSNHLKPPERYIKQKFDDGFYELFKNIFHIPEYEIQSFKDAYERSLHLSNTSKLLVSESNDIFYPSKIYFNQFINNTYCSSPYPSLASMAPILYVCDRCFDFFSSLLLFKHHKQLCSKQNMNPPGSLVYEETISGDEFDCKEILRIHEIDGQVAHKYCHDLCLFARSFLDHKTVYNTVETFLFYVLTLQQTSSTKSNQSNTINNDKIIDYQTNNEKNFENQTTCSFIGYFSKEKLQTFDSFNLSCIVVVPPFLQKGFGFFLIDFSYFISKYEKRFGTPERPFSSLGQITYSNYWKIKIIQYILECLEKSEANNKDMQLSIVDISMDTAIHPDDVLFIMDKLKMIRFDENIGKPMIVIEKQILNEIKTKICTSKRFCKSKNVIIKNITFQKTLNIYDQYMNHGAKHNYENKCNDFTIKTN